MKTARTEEKDTLFFEALGNGSTPPKAAEIAGYSRSTVYYLKKNYKDFKRRWKLAVSLYENKLLDEVDRRGRRGITKPVYYKGKIVGNVREYSDQLLMFRLKTLKPEKYNTSLLANKKDDKDDDSDKTSINLNFYPSEDN